MLFVELGLEFPYCGGEFIYVSEAILVISLNIMAMGSFVNDKVECDILSPKILCRLYMGYDLRPSQHVHGKRNSHFRLHDCCPF